MCSSNRHFRNIVMGKFFYDSVKLQILIYWTILYVNNIKKRPFEDNVDNVIEEKKNEDICIRK